MTAKRTFECPECAGECHVEHEYGITDWTWGHDIGTETVTCPKCDGRGEVSYDDLENALADKAIDYDTALAWAIDNGCDLIEARELLADYGYNPKVTA